jgi:hypothetical protein
LNFKPLQIVKRLLGIVILTIATFLFIAVTTSINAAQSMGGPMNIWPMPEEWFAIALVIDAVLLTLVYGGIKVSGLSRRVVGILSLLVAIAILSLGIENHVHAPPLDGPNETNKWPVPAFLHYAVYGFALIFLAAGVWLSVKRTKIDHGFSEEA